MEIRTLRRTEREPLLRLLDHWDVGDGWQGSSFFRRYQGDEPAFRDEQVWVAAEGEDLMSCIQIFPRPLQTPAGSVPMGGIGTVFTHPEARLFAVDPSGLFDQLVMALPHIHAHVVKRLHQPFDIICSELC